MSKITYNSTLALAALSLGLVSSVLSAGELQLDSFHIGGECSPGNTNGYLTEEDDLAIEFFDMKINSLPDEPSRDRKCNFEANVRVPAGYRVAAQAVVIEGEAFLPVDGYAEVATSYQMLGVGEKIRWHRTSSDYLDPQYQDEGRMFPEGFSSFSINKHTKHLAFSACGQDVSFVGDLYIAAVRGQDPNSQTSVILTDAIGQNKVRIAWNWVVEPCQSQSLPSQWSTHYQVNGQLINTQIILNGSTGSYVVGNTQGHLSQIQLQGKKMTGKWQLGTSQGWFVFNLADSYQSFSGYWGKPGSSTVMGNWWGVATGH